MSNVTATRALLTSVYGSPAGALTSYMHAPAGMISPCLAHQSVNRCYVGEYNFMDPDSYLSMSALLYAFDPYLTNEARKLLVTVSARLCRTKETWCR